MTGSTRKPTTYLSLVKDKTGQQAGKFLSLESLPTDQAEIVQRYHKMISPTGVLVGVVAGALEWDLRPLILLRGVMTISRVFSPQLLSSITLSDAFKSYVFHIERLFSGQQGYSCGSGDGYSWITRRYFNHIIGEQGLDLSLQDKVQLIGGLLSDIEKLHSNSLIHGHICPANLAFENGRLILLDHGFQIHDPGTSHPGTTAPELRSGVAGQLNASPAADMYGLGLVTKKLLGNSLDTEYGNLVEVLLLSDPTMRPRLPQIVTHFIPEPQESTKKEAPAVVQSGSRKATAAVHRESHASQAFLQKYLPIGVAAGLLLYMFGGSAVEIIRSRTQQSHEGITKLEKYWDSGQPALMQQVVGAALKNNDDAQNLIFERIAANRTHPAIQASLFRAALNPAWEDELSRSDLSVLLKLGLPTLVPSEFRDMPDFASVHPGVLLAIVGHMTIDEGMAALKVVQLNRFSSLPLPYGAAFSALEKLDISTLSDPAAQALCHIFAGDTSPEIMRAYLSSAGNVQKTFAKLEVLSPLFDAFDGLDSAVLTGLSTVEEGDAQILTWFAKDLVADWGKIGPRVKLALFSGVFPAETLSFEQYADLLRFPRTQIRDRAKESLMKTASAKMDGVLSFLASKDSGLTRTQTISLLAALLVKSDIAHSFVAQWFDTSPDPMSVAQILIRRPEIEGMDAFSLDAARYLVDKDFDLSLEDIKGLALHSEPLARTLAYTRLRTDVPEERALLRTFAERESVQRIKAQILLRLAEGQEPEEISATSAKAEPPQSKVE